MYVIDLLEYVHRFIFLALTYLYFHSKYNQHCLMRLFWLLLFYKTRDMRLMMVRRERFSDLSNLYMYI